MLEIDIQCKHYYLLRMAALGRPTFKYSAVPLEIHIFSPPDKHYCPRMAEMNRATVEGTPRCSSGYSYPGIRGGGGGF